MDPDGGNRRVIPMPGNNLLYSTSPPLLSPVGIPAGSDVVGRNGCWSPTSDQIAFMSDRDGNWEIYVMNGDGTDQRRLTVNAAPDLNPQFLR